MGEGDEEQQPSELDFLAAEQLPDDSPRKAVLLVVDVPALPGGIEPSVPCSSGCEEHNPTVSDRPCRHHPQTGRLVLERDRL